MYSLIQKIIRLKKPLIRYTKETTKDAEAIMLPFSLFVLINLPAFYLINLYLNVPQDKNSIIIRAIGSILCIILILKNRWPSKAKIYLPLFWYVTVLFTMPFFASFMALSSHLSTQWILNSLSIFIILILMVDWISYIILTLSGMLLGALLYYVLTPHPFPFLINNQDLSLFDIVVTYTVSLILIVICSRKRQSIEQEKLEAMKAVAACIAHELRTPLASINAGINGIQNYLPILISGYELAKQNELSIVPIREDHYAILTSDLLNEIKSEANLSQIIIDMLLLKVNYNLQDNKFGIFSIRECVMETLQRYPFNSHTQKHLITVNIDEDFLFMGEKLFMIHILFNLLKNSFYYIAELRKGEIYIWSEIKAKINILHFKDTAKGISPKIYAHIFKKFMSYTHNGTGLGLYFCQITMEKFGGDIQCKTQEGEYTEFILSFPKIN